MTKRIVLGLLVMAAAAGFLGAQENAGEAPVEQAAGGAKIALSLDTFPLIKGVIWSDNDADNSQFALAPVLEFLVAPHFAVGAGADLYIGKVSDIDVFYLGLAVHGRWYPLSSGLDKLFIDAGLGFNLATVDGNDAKPEEGGMTGITASLKAGWKLMFGSRFFVEPSMAFIYAKTPMGGYPTPVGWQAGLAIGLTF
ncbi:MAG: hypothetical protein LBG76_03930 [Treponema sp.]|jgi:hypothetical protein|nr:hypothetical protein [Treponema sp.]